MPYEREIALCNALQEASDEMARLYALTLHRDAAQADRFAHVAAFDKCQRLWGELDALLRPRAA